MKKISAILLSAIMFAACHNEGSSTVGVYDSDEPVHAKEHKEGHDEPAKSDAHENLPEPAVKETMDSAKMHQADSSLKPASEKH